MAGAGGGGWSGGEEGGRASDVPPRLIAELGAQAGAFRRYATLSEYLFNAEGTGRLRSCVEGCRADVCRVVNSFRWVMSK